MRGAESQIGKSRAAAGVEEEVGYEKRHNSHSVKEHHDIIALWARFCCLALRYFTQQVDRRNSFPVGEKLSAFERADEFKLAWSTRALIPYKEYRYPA